MNKLTISVILDHPDKQSFNHTIAATVVRKLNINKHRINFHDLYAKRFDPILPSLEIPTEAPLQPDIKRHCDEIQRADGIVIIHPNQWGQPPAILKGWVDRVIRPQAAYTFLDEDNGEGIPVGLLKAQTAIVLNTANTPPEMVQKI